MAQADNRQIEQAREKIERLLREVHRVVVGQEAMLHRLLIGLLTGGHILLEGVPGLAKTLTVSTLAQALHLGFRRIQFTPDLLPADLTGTLIYNQHAGKFEVKKGPVFTNVLLADEINRSPAKVQSALLEAMQERQVTIADTSYPLEKPFLVLATQNPIDQEGTYPLPEAQTDRFMLKIHVDYPTREEELMIMQRMARATPTEPPKPVLNAAEIAEMRKLIDQIRLEERLETYIVDMVLATRQPADYGCPDLKRYIEFGASPRATIALNLGARASAMMAGRDYVLPEDIKGLAPDALNHRLLLTYEAEADGVTSRDCIAQLLNARNI